MAKDRVEGREQGIKRTDHMSGGKRQRVGEGAMDRNRRQGAKGWRQKVDERGQETWKKAGYRGTGRMQKAQGSEQGAGGRGRWVNGKRPGAGSRRYESAGLAVGIRQTAWSKRPIIEVRVGEKGRKAATERRRQGQGAEVRGTDVIGAPRNIKFKRYARSLKDAPHQIRIGIERAIT